MELERFLIAQKIDKELNYWRDCLLSMEENTHSGLVWITIGGQDIKLDAKELAEITKSLKMTLEGKIKLLEEKFKKL